MSTTPVIPQSQFNAFPYLTIGQYLATTGDVEIVPGQLLRYFTPAETGINGIPANSTDLIDPTHPFGFIGLPMNCRGARRFTFLCSMKMREWQNDQAFPSPVEILSTGQVAAEPGVSIPPAYGVLGNWLVCARFTMNKAYPVFPPPGNPLDPATYPIVYKSASCSWDVGCRVGGAIQYGLTGPVTIRLRCSGGVSGGLFYDGQMYGSLWAST